MGLPPWEEIEHTADWALKVQGQDRRALFENAALGMLSLLGGQVDPDQVPIHKIVELEAPDWETLLVDWLTELLYLIEDGGIIFDKIVVHRAEDLHLSAEVCGKPGTGMEKHIKAVTYHNLSIQATEHGYETIIVFDV